MAPLWEAGGLQRTSDSRSAAQDGARNLSHNAANMTHTDTRQPQTTLTNHSFIESLASSGAAWVTISKHIYNINIILSINYTASIHYDSFIVKSFRK